MRKTSCPYMSAEKLECKSLYLHLFNSVMSGLHIKEATKVIVQETILLYWGQGCLGKEVGKCACF